MTGFFPFKLTKGGVINEIIGRTQAGEAGFYYDETLGRIVLGAPPGSQPEDFDGEEYQIPNQAAHNLFTTRRETKPRLNFLYFARFVPNTSDNSPELSKLHEMLTKTQAGDYMRENVFGYDVDAALYSRINRISGVAPSLQFQKFNFYNRKRNVLVDYEYPDATFEWWDTVDSAAMNFWKLYYAYHMNQAFINPRHPELAEPYEGAGTPDNPLKQNMLGRYGLNLRQKPKTSNFFKRIEIYQMDGGSFCRYDLINPEIVSFSHPELGNEETGAGRISMTISYENIQYIVHEYRIRDQYGYLHESLEGILNLNVQGRLPKYTQEHVRDYIDVLNDIVKGDFKNLTGGDIGLLVQAGVENPTGLLNAAADTFLRDRLGEDEYKAFIQGDLTSAVDLAGKYLNINVGTNVIT